jgi:hypothetical protein
MPIRSWIKYKKKLPVEILKPLKVKEERWSPRRRSNPGHEE